MHISSLFLILIVTSIIQRQYHLHTILAHCGSCTNPILGLWLLHPHHCLAGLIQRPISSVLQTCSAFVQASPEGPRKATVVAHLMPADVGSIKQESSILKQCCIHFINHGQHSKQEMEALVRKLGGTVSVLP